MTPSTKSAVPVASCCSSRLELELLVERSVVGVIEQPLRQADPACRLLGVAGRELGGAAGELLGLDDLGDESPRVRLGRGQLPVRRHPLERAREAEQAVDEPRAARVGDEADADEAGHESGGVARRSGCRTPQASESPAPAHGPFTAAITGFSSAADQRGCSGGRSPRAARGSIPRPPGTPSGPGRSRSRGRRR